MTLTDALKDDAQRMEDVCIKLGNRTDIWQDRIIYWMAVAILHIIEWIVKKGEK